MNISLAAWREELGYSIEDLAKELGVQPDELQIWEKDFGKCAVARLVEMALNSIEAKRAFDRVSKALDEVKFDDSVLERANAFLAKVKQRESHGEVMVKVENMRVGAHKEMADFSQSAAVWEENGIWIGAIIHTRTEVITRAKSRIAAEADLEEAMKKRAER